MKSSLISNIAAVNKIIEIKKFLIKEDYSYLLTNPELLIYIRDIGSKINLDLLTITAKEDLLKYEKYMQNALRDALRIGDNSQLLDEELSFLNSCISYPLALFPKDKRLGLHKVLKSADYVSAITTIPFISSSIRNAERIDSISGHVLHDANPNWLVKSKIQLRSRAAYALTHVVDEDVPGQLVIQSCFFFNVETSYNLSPSRMFLRAINKYGAVGSAGGKEGKFIFEYTSSNLSIDRSNIDKLGLYRTNDGSVLQFITQIKDRDYGGKKFFMSYGLNISKMKKDLVKMSFI